MISNISKFYYGYQYKKEAAAYYDKYGFDNKCKQNCPNTNSFRSMFVFCVLLCATVRIGEIYRNDQITNKFILILFLILIVAVIIISTVIYFHYVYMNKYMDVIEKNMRASAEKHFVNYLDCYADTKEETKAATENYKYFTRWFTPFSLFKYGYKVEFAVYQSFVQCEDLSRYNFDETLKHARGW